VADERPLPVEEVLEQFDELAAASDHFEFYWFPYGRQALVKRNHRLTGGDAERGTPVPAALPAWRRFWEFEVMENAGFGTLCRLGRARPRLIPALNRFSSAALSTRTYTDTSHRVFVTPRRVRFAESEYAVPRESLGQVITELRSAVPRLHHPVMFPVEVRVAAADDIWLSTGIRPGVRLRRHPPVHRAALPGILRPVRVHRGRRWTAGRTGASCIRSTPDGSARSIPASTSSAGPRRGRSGGRFGNAYLTRSPGRHDL
jgi:D-arabinono-1,4-lactone oxidase.